MTNDAPTQADRKQLLYGLEHAKEPTVEAVAQAMNKWHVDHCGLCGCEWDECDCYSDSDE